jgi:hypothetical protein
MHYSLSKSRYRPKKALGYEPLPASPKMIGLMVKKRKPSLSFGIMAYSSILVQSCTSVSPFRLVLLLTQRSTWGLEKLYVQCPEIGH